MGERSGSVEQKLRDIFFRYTTARFEVCCRQIRRNASVEKAPRFGPQGAQAFGSTLNAFAVATRPGINETMSGSISVFAFPPS
jgi:hypothetical protein